MLTENGSGQEQDSNENPRAKFIKTFLNPEEDLGILYFRNWIKMVQNTLKLSLSIYYANNIFFSETIFKLLTFNLIQDRIHLSGHLPSHRVIGQLLALGLTIAADIKHLSGSYHRRRRWSDGDNRQTTGRKKWLKW